LVSVSRLVSRSIFASLGLEGFKSRLGLECFRSRDFEHCKEIVYQNLYNSTIFCLLYLQVKTAKTRRKMPEIKKKLFQKCERHFFLISAKSTNFDVSSLGLELRVSGFLIKSRSRLEILTKSRSRSRRLRSRLHHCFIQYPINIW